MATLSADLAWETSSLTAGLALDPLVAVHAEASERSSALVAVSKFTRMAVQAALLCRRLAVHRSADLVRLDHAASIVIPVLSRLSSRRWRSGSVSSLAGRPTPV